jgi:4-hydroxybenzoate polyprenyltransferase
MLAYLRFIRFPGVFTAFADALAGFFIAHGAVSGALPDGNLVTVLVAVGCFYLGGMAWNDLFDVEEDALRRPERPLPAGEVKMTGGYLLATTLIGAALMLTMTVSAVTFSLGAGLTLLIFAYNGGLKEIEFIGPLAMGGCRSLSMALGMSVAPERDWTDPLLWLAPTLLGIYIAAVTLLATEENDVPAVSAAAPVIADASANRPTEFDEPVLTAPQNNPQYAVQLNNLYREQNLRILTTQNSITAPSEPLPPPTATLKFVTRTALLTLIAAAVAIVFLAPQTWAAGIYVALWGLLMLKPCRHVWHQPEPPVIRGAVGMALSGICLIDAALMAGFCPGFFTQQPLMLASLIIAAAALPVRLARRFIV